MDVKSFNKTEDLNLKESYISPRNSLGFAALNFKDMNLQRYQSEDETPTPKLSNPRDQNSFRKLETPIPPIMGANVQSNLMQIDIPQLAVPTFTQSVSHVPPSNPNRFMAAKVAPINNEEKKTFTRAESMPIINQK